MNASKLLATISLCLLGMSKLWAQPATASLQLIPPHSPFLADFTEPAAQNLLFTLQLLDHPSGSMDVRLKLRITGGGVTLTTNNNWIPPSINLNTGIPQLFSGYDLMEYFDPYHLDFQGISREQFIQNGGLLPEGFYEVCLQAFNYDPGQDVIASNNACANAFLEYYDPPEVTQPIGEQQVFNPQTLLFNWLPYHPVGSFITEYDLQVWKVNPDLTYEQIVNFEPIFFQVTLTNMTTFQYGMIQPQLMEGQEYITRVRAKAQNGAAVFRNEGYSPIVAWSWGPPQCFPPENVSLTQEGLDTVRITWDWPLGNPISQYVIRYQGVGNEPHNWVSINVSNTDTEYLFSNLDAEGAYRFEIKSECNPGESEWADLGTVVMGDGSSYVCGLPISDLDLSADNLLSNLNVDDEVIAGDFKVIITGASGVGGKFWGTGYIYVPYFNKARVNVKFNGVTINREYRMVRGAMKVTGAGVAIINSEMAELISDILETLETIDDWLAAAEQILQALDEIIAEIEPYLPEGIIEALINAQQQLEDAKRMMENGEPGAEQAMADAQEALNNANAAYKAALEAFIAEFIDILKKTFIELNADYVNQVSALEASFNSSNSDLTSYMDGVYQPIMAGASSSNDAPSFVGVDILTETANIDSLANTDPAIAPYLNKAKAYWTDGKALRQAQVLQNLKAELIERNEIDGFVALMKREKLNLIKEIGERIKDEVDQQEIIDHVKDKIIETIEKILWRVANASAN